MSVPDMLGERSRAMTRGAVSVTKGEGAGRQAGPAAASVISMAAPISRSGAWTRRAALRPMVSAASRCGAMSGAGGRLGGALAAEEEPEPGEGQQRRAGRAGGGR